MPTPSPSKPRPAPCTEPHAAAPAPAGARRRPSRAAERGLSLIELVMFIAIVGIAIAGVLVVYDRAVSGSADPLVRKQAAAIAESLLGEVLMQPFTWCDPQDPANDADPPPSSAAACTGGAVGSQDKGGGTLGPQPASESRLSATDPFDNVADYHGTTLSAGIVSLDGQSFPELAGYSASVSVTRAGALFGIADDAVLRVDVQVSGHGETITLTGYRFRHSPNATG